MKLLMAAILLASTSIATAETSPPFAMSGGIICDTLDDVVTYLDTEVANTCGRLVTPTVGTVTILGTYVVVNLEYTLVRYDFISPANFNAVQYGWYGQPKDVGEQT